MSGFLQALGQKLAERWLTLLVLPGTLFLATAITAQTLGQVHALDYHRLIEQITRWAHTPATTAVGGQVVILGSVLAAAAATGLAAQGLATLVQRAVLAVGWHTWPRPLRAGAHALVVRRRTRWTAAAHRYRQQLDADGRALARTGRRADLAPRRAAHHAMVRIATEEPDRPTWSGDRIHAVTIRLERDHHLDLPALWPYLWLTVPETTRTEITTAEQALARATALGGWALLYALLTAWWWPAALLATALGLTARYRIRCATDTYALLLEAAVRLHTTGVATRLGIDHTGHADSALGDALTHQLRAQTPSPPTDGGTPPHNKQTD